MIFLIQSAVQNTFNEPSASTETVESVHNQQNIFSSSQSSSMSSLASSLNSFGNTTINSNNNNRPGTSASLNELHDNAIFDLNNHFSSLPPPPPPLNNRQITRPNSQQQTLPNINVFTQRTLSYHAPRPQMVVPRGFFQWSIFIVAFPFKLIFSTLMDVASYFCELVFLNDYRQQI